MLGPYCGKPVHFMRILLLYILIVTASLKPVQGQFKALDKSDIADTSRPLILVDSFRTDMKYLIMDPQMIASIDVYKDSNAIRKFGEKGKYGVIIIRPKAGANFLQIAKILEKYSVSNPDRKLRVCVNNTLIQEPELILIEESEMLYVEITTERRWTASEDANSGEKFINIVTKVRD